MNQTHQTNQINQIHQIDEIDETDQIDQTDEMDEIGVFQGSLEFFPKLELVLLTNRECFIR